MKTIPLTQGREAIVDDDDVELVARYRWSAQPRRGKTFYAATNVVKPGGPQRYTQLQMHRLIMGLTYGDPEKIDHVNGNGLDNRRENLRRATLQQNRWNSDANRGAVSRYKGVNWHWCSGKRSGKWRAQICVDGRQRHLGLFETEEAAAAAYAEAARTLHGAYARQ